MGSLILNDLMISCHISISIDMMAWCLVGPCRELAWSLEESLRIGSAPSLASVRLRCQHYTPKDGRPFSSNSSLTLPSLIKKLI